MVVLERISTPGFISYCLVHFFSYKTLDIYWITFCILFSRSFQKIKVVDDISCIEHSLRHHASCLVKFNLLPVFVPLLMTNPFVLNSALRRLLGVVMVLISSSAEQSMKRWIIAKR